MKAHFALLAAIIFAAVGSVARSQTLDWGSEVFSDLVDSNGDTLDSAFVFEIGAFVDGFVPQANNTSAWLENWRVFDRASYNQGDGYFTHWSSESDTLRMLDDGTSNSPYMTPGSLSFEGLNAFLWIRKGDAPVEGSEWLLTRSSSWVFPNATPGCCDDELPVQWSVSQLGTGDVPEWGNQGGVSGSGVFSVSGPYTLQTYTFVPEPSAALMVVLSGCGMVLRRRRCSR